MHVRARLWPTRGPSIRAHHYLTYSNCHNWDGHDNDTSLDDSHHVYYHDISNNNYYEVNLPDNVHGIYNINHHDNNNFHYNYHQNKHDTATTVPPSGSLWISSVIIPGLTHLADKSYVHTTLG